MPSLNHVVIAGRLTRDAELKYTPNGIAKLEIPLAVSKRVKAGDKYEDNTFFLDVAAWRGLADTLAPVLKKGVPILIEGEINIEDWTGKDGTQRRRAVINANRIHTLEWRKPASRPDKTAAQQQQEGEWPNDRNGVDDLPF